MKAIKFSEDYLKLPLVWEGTHARLMAVCPINIESLKNGLTAFWKNDVTTRDFKEYPLDFEHGLILFFIHYNTGWVFTTIRRDYPVKRKYYQDSIGETFILERSADV